MSYYVYRADANDFAGIGFSSADNERIVAVHFTDTPLAGLWVAPVAHGFGDNPEAEGDFPSLSNYNMIPVMSERAWKVLSPIIGYCCEALPCIHPTGKQFFIIHVMETIDGLDCAKSQLTRNAATGRVNKITRYELKSELLANKRIFKLPVESGGELLVDDGFARAVEANGLKGLRLKGI